MRKQQELTDPASCLNRARPEELVFVLLGRDVAAPEAIRAWCRARVALGENNWDDSEIREAYETARLMSVEREDETPTPLYGH